MGINNKDIVHWLFGKKPANKSEQFYFLSYPKNNINNLCDEPFMEQISKNLPIWYDADLSDEFHPEIKNTIFHKNCIGIIFLLTKSFYIRSDDKPYQEIEHDWAKEASEEKGINNIYYVIIDEPKDIHEKRYQFVSGIIDQHQSVFVWKGEKYEHLQNIIQKRKKERHSSNITWRKGIKGRSSFTYDSPLFDKFFVARSDELDLLDKFCNKKFDQDDICLIKIYGKPGCGKSKLIYWFCKNKLKGWRIWMPGSYNKKAFNDRTNYLSQNTLICIDNASTKTDVFKDLLERIESDNLIIGTYKLRIIIIDRKKEDLNRICKNYIYDEYNSIKLNELSDKDLDKVLKYLLNKRQITKNKINIKEFIDNLDEEIKSSTLLSILSFECYLDKKRINNNKIELIEYIHNKEFNNKIDDAIENVTGRKNSFCVEDEIFYNSYKLFINFALLLAELYIFDDKYDINKLALNNKNMDNFSCFNNIEKERAISIMNDLGFLSTEGEIKYINKIEPDILSEYGASITINSILNNNSVKSNDFIKFLYDFCFAKNKWEALLFTKKIFDELPTFRFDDIWNRQFETVNVPNTYTAIYKNFFKNWDFIKIVYLPFSISKIDQSAFENCKSLQQVNYTCALELVAPSAFKECINLSKFKCDYDPTIAKIEKQAFYHCRNLNNVDFFSDSLKHIGNSAFEGCSSIKSIYIPLDSEFLDHSFKDCINIKTIIFNEKVSGKAIFKYHNIDLADNTFDGCLSEIKCINMPDNGKLSNIIWKKTKIRNIEESNNQSNNNTQIYNENIEFLKEVIIPEGYNSFDKNLFYENHIIENVILPASLNKIPSHAFENCYNLKKVTFNKNSEINTIPECCFRNCISLQEIFVPDSISEIKFMAFSQCEILNKIKINYSPNLIIENNAFENCGELTWIFKHFYNKKNNNISPSAFIGCKKFNFFKLNKMVQYFYIKKLNKNRQTDLQILNKIKSFIQDFFINYGKNSVIKIPEGILSFRSIVFINKQFLESIFLPKSFNKLPLGAFSHCYSLKEVFFHWKCELKDIRTETFENCINLKTLKIFYNKKNFSKSNKLPDSIENIYSKSFKECTSLESINLNNTKIKNIGNRAFSTCKALKYIQLPNTLTSINDYAFEYCYQLLNIYIPDKLDVLKNGAFYNCSHLKIIKNSKNIRHIGDMAFKKCSALLTYNFSNDIEFIGTESFKECHKLKIVSIPNGSYKLGSHVFEECKSIEKFKIPFGCYSITPGMFKNCTKLSKIEISDKINFIGQSAFFGNNNLNEVSFYNYKNETSFPNNITIADRSFEGCDSLYNVSFIKKIQEIPKRSFNYCSSIQQIDLGCSIIDEYAFASCLKLEKISFNRDNTLINCNKGCFLNCQNLKSIKFAKGSRILYENITFNDEKKLIDYIKKQ